MIIKWTANFATDFDLDQAEEDFRFIMEQNPNKDPESAIYDVVEANWSCDGEEYINTYEGIENCAKALRERIGGVQMRMELN